MGKQPIVFRDLLFYPYPGGGFQSLIDTKWGRVSVRYGSPDLIANSELPFEVWYPTHYAPHGYQTEKDVYYFMKTGEVLCEKDFDPIKNTERRQALACELRTKAQNWLKDHLDKNDK